MAMPAMPHPHLIILRTVATVVISCLIGQAGWASAFLGGSEQYRAFHQVGAVVAVAVTVLGALVYVVLRRSAGLVNVILAVLLAVMIVVQYLLGASGTTSLHIFWGVMLIMLGTALTSWTYRHQMPANA